MNTPISPAAKRIGYGSALLSLGFSLVYVAGQIAEWIGLLGSHGGPESASTPLGLAILLLPSLLLGSSFLVLIATIHHLTFPERRLWSQIALAFATVYTGLISLVYFVQLTLVLPHLMRGETAGIEMLLFTPFDSFLYAVDILGYSFMSLATLFVAGVFPGKGLQRLARLFLLANGALLPFIALQMYYHPLVYIAALWAITFPGATGVLMLIFHRAPSTAETEPPLEPLPPSL
ncbi:hypothetical protein [Lyngbya confervoides]|uniref:DUF4386 domain-containing protein n=1 Tax=Lyngbya confervoides BDU141951 TaxID=1574623 RepID=A0ABD4T6H7_9CYAN|nr:hypothetical protein [Lyngbya confervoides]MCM1984058.1 hypothetical protein [Lyngbya confervoides BDU141951]